MGQHRAREIHPLPHKRQVTLAHHWRWLQLGQRVVREGWRGAVLARAGFGNVFLVEGRNAVIKDGVVWRESEMSRMDDESRLTIKVKERLGELGNVTVAARRVLVIGHGWTLAVLTDIGSAALTPEANGLGDGANNVGGEDTLVELFVVIGSLPATLHHLDENFLARNASTANGHTGALLWTVPHLEILRLLGVGVEAVVNVLLVCNFEDLVRALHWAGVLDGAERCARQGTPTSRVKRRGARIGLWGIAVGGRWGGWWAHGGDVVVGDECK